jgi:long-chain acyl-CoA synthetase
MRRQRYNPRVATATPWLAHYDAGVPPSLAPYAPRTLIECLSELAASRPDASAVLFKGARVSYAELDAQSDACAAALESLGVRRGDRVGLLLPNCPQFFVAQFAIWKIGGIVAPLNPIHTEHELEGPIRDNGIDTIVTLTRFYDRVKRVQARSGLRRVIATNIKQYFPWHLRVLFTLFREAKDGDRVTLQAGDEEFGALLARHRGRRPAAAAVTADDPAVLLMSGGTTGTPKGALGRHGSYTITGRQVQAWTASVLDRDSVILLPLPLFHVYANVGVQALAFVSGCPIAVVPNPRDLDDVLATIRAVRPTFFNGVPTLYVALINHPDVQKGEVEFKSIKICFSGAAPLMAETKQRFESLTGGRIVEGYSLTEAMMALVVNPVQNANKLGSVGLPLPDVQVRIVDGEEGVRELAAGEVGEVCLSAPQLMIGFWNQPAETAVTLRDHHEPDGTTRRWLHTGDLGYLDDQGYLFIVDRKKDLVKISGYQVWPREIEEALATHPAVAEVGVTGVPDETRGETIWAWVVLRTGESADEARLRAYCRERLAPYKVPSHIEIRAELPKTMVGKVLRRALREEAARARTQRH